jgi:predicted membrane protein (TIGR00267 family)
MILAKLLRGFTDGSLSTLGIVIGAYAAPNTVVVAAALGGAVANAISNALSAFSAAEAEQYSKMRDIEDAMVSKELKGSVIEQKIHRETWLASAADGLASILGGFIPILPCIFLQPHLSTYVAAGLVIFMIFLIGIYLGQVSKRNLLLSGLKMAFFGIVIAAIVFVIQMFVTPTTDA